MSDQYALHADFCGWHVDQHATACTCGVERSSWRRFALRPNEVVEHHRDGPRIVTIGADVERDRVEYEIQGWAGGERIVPLGYVGTLERQSKADSFMESLTNIAIGLAVSQVANLIVLPLVFHVPVSGGQALALGAIYTAISLVRSYAIRRAFNGRSVWSAIKGVFR